MKVRGLAGRQKQNFFGQEEDEKIVKALQEALGSPGMLIYFVAPLRLCPYYDIYYAHKLLFICANLDFTFIFFIPL